MDISDSSESNKLVNSNNLNANNDIFFDDPRDCHAFDETNRGNIISDSNDCRGLVDDTYAQTESGIVFQEYSDNVNTNQSTQEGYKLIDEIIDSTQSVALDLDNFINLDEIGSKYIKQALPADDVISKSVISEQFIIDDFVEFDFDSILIGVSELG